MWYSRPLLTAEPALQFGRWLSVALLLLFAISPAAATQVDTAHVMRLDVFVRSDSPHSQRAAQFARELAARRSGLQVAIHDVLVDERQRAVFWELNKKFRAQKPGLPAFYACNRAGFGFADAETSGRAVENLFTIRLFVRQGCPHCADAKQFLAGLVRRWPAMRLEVHDVIADRQAQKRMADLASQYQVSVPSLPAVEMCGEFIVGYDRDATTGRQLEAILEGAREPLRGIQLPPATVSPEPEASAARPPQVVLTFASFSVNEPEPADPFSLPPVIEDDTELADPGSALRPQRPDAIALPWFGSIRVEELGLPAFTVAIGLVDGFNPCAMWVLVFLLSILVNVRSRARMIAIAGTFVLVSGLAYFVFMAAWLNVFLLVGILRPLQILLGLLAIAIGMINVKDFVAFKRGISLSIPESAKAGIYDRVRRIVTARSLSVAIGLAVVLAVAVNIVELLCTAGLPALYTQILTMQQLPAWQNYVYLLLYNLAYMFDDALMLSVFVVTLSHRKIQEREGRWLKLFSGLVILALGLLMLFRPEWLQLSNLDT